MAEQRLIDANVLLQYMSDMDVQTGKKCCTQAVKSCIEEFFPQVVFDQPTIDPETIPIVRQLRAELARVTEDRDAAVEQLHGKCYACKHNNNPFHSSGKCEECKYRYYQFEMVDNHDYWEFRGPHMEE